MKTVRLTTAEAIVRYLIAQRTVIDGAEVPLVPGVFAIFGHGNVTCLGPALHAAGDDLPTYRGQNEQGMALAAVAYAKAMRRRQFMVATSSIGPGALNMVTAAGVAMANRLPVLLLAGDTFQSRLPDPVLQQLEHFGAPSTTANDAFRPVVRYWDRITRPEQVVQSLPQAMATLLDPADCGPAFLALPQDVQAEAYDFPARLFEPVVHERAPPAPGPGRARAPPPPAMPPATSPLLDRRWRRALLAGRGRAGRVRRAPRHPRRRDRRRQVDPDVGPPEASPGRSVSSAASPPTAWPPRPTSSSPSGPGCRTSPPARGPCSATRSCASSASTRPASTPASTSSLPVVGDALESLTELGAPLGDWRCPPAWTARVATEVAGYWTYVDGLAAPADGRSAPTYAQVVGAVSARATPDDYALTASGGFPGELNNGWRSKGRRHVRLRVRLLVHGLRDERRLGRGDGPGHAGAGRSGDRLRRRRVVPHDEQRPVLVRAGRARR